MRKVKLKKMSTKNILAVGRFFRETLGRKIRNPPAGYPPEGGRISSGFCPMRIELREAKIFPNNKDCLQNIFLIIIIVVIILKKMKAIIVVW